MTGNWQLFLRHDEDMTADGGEILHVHLYHLLTGVRLVAQIIRNGNEPPFVDAIVDDDLSLPSAVLRRLIGKVFEQHRHLFREDTPCVTIATLNLEHFICDVYDRSDAGIVSEIIDTSFATMLVTPSSDRGCATPSNPFAEHVDWWEIELTRRAAGEVGDAIFCLGVFHNHQINRDVLRNAFLRAENHSISDLFKKVRRSQRLSLQITCDDIGEPILKSVKRDGFGLSRTEIVALGNAVFRHLFPHLTQSETSINAVIHLESWVDEFLSPSVASHVLHVLHRSVPPPPAAKENHESVAIDHL